MQKNLRLKLALFEEGIAQKHLAQMVGVPESYLSMMVNGRMNINPALQKKIAIALGRGVSELF